MLISPRITWSSSGSSSRLVLRRKRPNEVIRSLSGSKSPLASNLPIMVRNLRSVNTFPCSPGRCCRNRTGVPRNAPTRSEIKIITGNASNRAGTATHRSNSRLHLYSTTGWDSFFIRLAGSSFNSNHSRRHLGRERNQFPLAFHQSRSAERPEPYRTFVQGLYTSHDSLR